MKLTKMNISAIKRTAQTVYPYKKKLVSLKEKIAALQEEIQDIEFTIDSYEAPIKKMTGFTSSDLVIRKATITDNIDKNGKPIASVTWEFTGIPEPANNDDEVIGNTEDQLIEDVQFDKPNTEPNNSDLC